MVLRKYKITDAILDLVFIILFYIPFLQIVIVDRILIGN